MPCPTCRGYGGWWEWWNYQPRSIHRHFARLSCNLEPGEPQRGQASFGERPPGVPGRAGYRICPDCIGGTASCCDAAGAEGR